jgi:hypothetical protein
MNELEQEKRDAEKRQIRDELRSRRSRHYDEETGEYYRCSCSYETSYLCDECMIRWKRANPRPSSRPAPPTT